MTNELTKEELKKATLFVWFDSNGINDSYDAEIVEHVHWNCSEGSKYDADFYLVHVYCFIDGTDDKVDENGNRHYARVLITKRKGKTGIEWVNKKDKCIQDCLIRFIFTNSLDPYSYEDENDNHHKNNIFLRHPLDYDYWKAGKGAEKLFG